MSTQDAANLALLVVALGLGAAVLLPRRRTHHRPWGLRPDRGTAGRYLLGVALAAATIGGSFVVLVGSGLTDSRPGEPQTGEIVSIAVYFVILAAVEELVFRGLLLNGVVELTGRAVVAVPLVAVAVAVPYAFADGVSALSLLSAVLAGVMYGVAFLVSGSVWTAAGMRASWNLALGPVLGFDVSGQSLVDHPVLEQSLDGAPWLTGGDYGPEGGVVVVLARVALIAGLLLWWRSRRAAERPGRRAGRRPGPGPARSSTTVACVAVLALAGCTSGSGPSPGRPAPGASVTGPAPLEIDTTTGTLRGRESGATRQFLGVRYAEAPTGQRRWALPEPAGDTDEVLDATTSGPACPQSGDVAFAASGTTDEDCLFLEVTTPRRAGDEPWPVMVWWHGGGFTSGAGSQYDARRIAEQGEVAVVTVNYRLGMLGYLALPGLEGGGNFGLADQLAALRWAGDNAAAFGGDPDNVTVFGQSAGGVSVCAALTSPGVDELLDKAVFASGSCRLAWPQGTLFPALPASRPLISRQESEDIGLAATGAVGCVGGDVLACLREQPVAALVAQSTAFGNPLAYGTDLLPQDPATAIEQGDVAAVPVITGGTRDEHRSFIGGLLLTDPGAVSTDAYPALVEASFGADAAAVLQRYPLQDGGSAPLVWSTLVTDVAWACPMTRGARDLAAAGATVHSYEFADPSAIDVSLVASSGVSQAGAHATDLPFLFDLAGQDLLATPEQRDLATTMIGFWTSFARTGTPTADGAPAWPETTSDDAPVLQLTSPEVRVVDHRAEHRCGFWESLDLW